MSPIIAKRCRICGDDVSSKKRTKDTTGNYYCHGCYAESIHVQEQEQDGIDLNALAALEPSSAVQDEGDPLAQLAALANAAPVDQPEIFMCPICLKYFTTAGMHYSGICVKCSSPRSSVPKEPATARRRRKIPVFVIVLACAVFGLVAVLLIPSHHQDSADDETDAHPSVSPVGADSQTATYSKDAQIAQEKRDEATREIEQRDAAQREAEESRERALASGPLRAAVLNYAAAKLDFGVRAAWVKPFGRQKMFSISIEIAVERIASNLSELEKYKAVEAIVGLSGMLDVPNDEDEIPGQMAALKEQLARIEQKLDSIVLPKP